MDFVEGFPAFERACLLSSGGADSTDSTTTEDQLAEQAASEFYKRVHTAYSAIFGADQSTELMKVAAKLEVDGRESAMPPTTSLTYGEIDFWSFADILERIEMSRGDTFVDLGSGTGRALVTAGLLFGPLLARVHGVEILQTLHERCEKNLHRLSAMLREDDAFAEHACCKLSSELGDATNNSTAALDWTVADVVFMNSTLFDDRLMLALSALAGAKMRKGTRVITLTRPLSSSAFSVIDTRNYRMSWGLAMAFFHVKM